MSFHYFAGHAYRALTARKDGPSLYEVCDPVLAGQATGDPHIAKFYKTALGNPALRVLLNRAGLPELRDETRLNRVREALRRAREDQEPDWAAVGAPVADLVDSIALDHPRPPKIAFNLIGDPDFRGRELIMALTGLNARGYKNSSLLFNLARVFIARSSAGAIINPPWKGIAEPMWEPVQIRHRSAYYDAFFIEALLAYGETGLASPADNAAAKAAIDDMVDFCINISREEVKAQDGKRFDVITALAPAPHPRFSRFFAQIKQDLGFGVYVPDCDTTACSFSAATQAGSTDPILDQPLLDF
ncbi:MAG: hypothetical protein ABUL53_09040, partial [Bradyrhizobium guangdongense]